MSATRPAVNPPAASLPTAGAWPDSPDGLAPLRDGWASVDDWLPTEGELADRQERAWEAADEAVACWAPVYAALGRLPAAPVAAGWLAVLTAVSRLPAPERDLLRGYLTTGLPTVVLAALFAMPECAFCEAVVEATHALNAAHSKRLTAPVKAAPTWPAGRRPDQAAAKRPAREVA